MSDKFIGFPVAVEAVQANDRFKPVEINGVYEYSPKMWLLKVKFSTDEGTIICTARTGKETGWEDNPRLMEAVLADLKLPAAERRRWEIEYETKSETSGDRTFRNNYVCGFTPISTGPSQSPTVTAAPTSVATADGDQPQWMGVEVNPVANSIRRSVAFKAASDKTSAILQALLGKVEVTGTADFIQQISPLLKELSVLEADLTDEAERTLLRLSSDEPEEEDDLFDSAGGV